MYWIFMSITYFFCCGLSLCSYWALESTKSITIGICGSLAVVLFFNVLLHYVMNDYNILEDREVAEKRLSNARRAKGLKEERRRAVQQELESARTANQT